MKIAGLRPLASRRHGEGFAAATVLFAIGLFVLLGTVTMATSRSNAKARQFQETKDQIVAQAELVFSTLVLCRTIYPAADNGTGFHKAYPATPAAPGLVSALVCPGQPGQSIWSGDARAMSPRLLPGFGAWTYVNDAASVRIQLVASNAGVTFYQDLLDAVVARTGAGVASRSGDSLTFTLFN